MSTSYFVAADWLIEHGDDPEVQIIDARMAPAGQEHLRDMVAEYRAGHLPGAVFFDIEALSDHNSPLPHMLPRPEAFSVAMRELGVNRDKHLVVYDEGNLFSAPRAWWMLNVFGAHEVAVPDLKSNGNNASEQVDLQVTGISGTNISGTGLPFAMTVRRTNPSASSSCA